MTTLAQYESYLADAGFTTQFVGADQGLGIDQVAVALEPDHAGRERVLWLAVFTGLEADLAHGHSMMQFAVVLPFALAAETTPAVQQYVLALNNVLPLIGFNVHPDPQQIIFRYVLMLGPDPSINGRLLRETIDLISFLLDEFSVPLEALTLGRISLDEALDALQGG